MNEYSSWEVVLAKNIKPPYRFVQEYYWLEVFAQDVDQAVEVAQRWVIENQSEWEATDMARVATEHHTEFRLSSLSQPIPISWNTPCPRFWPDHLMIREPSTGTKLGFLAGQKMQARLETILPNEYKGKFRLIVKRPVEDAVLVCLMPIVETTSLRWMYDQENTD